MTINDSLNVVFDIEPKLALIKRDNKGSSLTKINSSSLSSPSHYQEEAALSFQLTLFAPQHVHTNNNNINSRHWGAAAAFDSFDSLQALEAAAK